MCQIAARAWTRPMAEPPARRRIPPASPAVGSGIFPQRSIRPRTWATARATSKTARDRSQAALSRLKLCRLGRHFLFRRLGDFRRQLLHRDRLLAAGGQLLVALGGDALQAAQI